MKGVESPLAAVIQRTCNRHRVMCNSTGRLCSDSSIYDIIIPLIQIGKSILGVDTAGKRMCKPANGISQAEFGRIRESH